MKISLHRSAWPLLALLVLARCASMSEVEERGADIQKLIDQKKPAAYVCAPEELARAEANLEFARYQSTKGNGILAHYHLEEARRWVTEAWEKSNDKRCGPDADNDGIPDALDACPDRPEDFDGDRDEDGCPDLDSDGDGIDDDKDLCPTMPEDKDGFEDQDGCPDPDNDHDGVLDGSDKCPNDPEDLDGFEDQDGCPDPDNDKDGVCDPWVVEKGQAEKYAASCKGVDKCPNEAEDFDGDQDEDGCPDLYQNIVITQKKIELKEKIFFATASDRILPQSYGLLDEIVDALKTHPELRIRIEGHTDNKGAYQFNKTLSQRRADSVRRYVIQKGVEAPRLLSAGFGPDMPIDDNATEEGRANNRRVEFNIIE